MKPLLLLHVNHQPVNLITYIETLECVLGKTAKKNYLPMQDRDVPASFAHTEGTHGFRPRHHSGSWDRPVCRLVPDLLRSAIAHTRSEPLVARTFTPRPLGKPYQQCVASLSPCTIGNRSIRR